MTPETEAKLIARIEPDSIWIYKDGIYRVNCVLLKNLSQNRDTGEWQPSVRYTLEPQTDLVFYRAYGEFIHKFDRIA